MKTPVATRKRGFEPVADKNAVILILGTMPGEDSLRRHEYYGHPRNAFWKIMSALLGFAQNADYKQKTAALKQNRIALWDVIASCERDGSLDSRIDESTIKINNFAGFFKKHCQIERVFFNGARAEKEYVQRVLPTLSSGPRHLPARRLPSTSPAMASLGFEGKLRSWDRVTDHS
jgi:TDG/mug DNA glycosylase family protein